MTSPADTVKLSAGTLSLYIPEKKVDKDQLPSLQSAEPRNTLFYDESIRLYMQLDLKNLDLLQDQVNLLNVTVTVKVHGVTTAIATASSPQASTSASSRSNHAYSKTYDVANLLATKKDVIYSTSHTIIWSVPITIQHPRARLSNPVIKVSAVASLDSRPPQLKESDKEVFTSSLRQVQFLDSNTPVWATNYFGSLDKNYNAGQKKLDRKVPYANISTPLSTTQMTSSLNVDDSNENAFTSQSKDSQGLDTIGDDKIAASLSIPVQSAMNLRILSAKIRGKDDVLLTSLEVTVSDSSKYAIFVQDAIAELVDGQVSLIGPMPFPAKVEPGECLLLSYSLKLSEMQVGASRKKGFQLTVQSRPVVEEKQELQPLVTAKWDTFVDFDADSLPSAGIAPSIAPTSVAGYYSGPVGASGTPNMSDPKSPTRAFSRFNNRGAASSTTSLNTMNTMSSMKQSLNGLSITFSGASVTKVGETFSWKVFVVNKAPTVRALSLFFQGRDNQQASHMHDKFLSQSGPESRISLERALLKKVTSLSSVPDVGLVSLSNDVRIGPIPPMGCFEASVQMLALSEGIHALGGVVIADLTTGEGHECERLFDVVVTKA